MGMNSRSYLDDTTWEFPQTGFWVVHIIGTFFLIFLGMHLVARRAPLSLMALARLLRAFR